jgi:hypothetical protein
MVDLLLICALCDQVMFIACPLCVQPFYGDHAHLVCIKHDMNIADHHIAREYVDLVVKILFVIMVIKYEVMLLCFRNLTPICFRLKEL